MKATIHPTFYEDALVTCVCGNTFTTGSTRKGLKTEFCSVAPRFFTAARPFVEPAGQFGRFPKRAAKAP